MMNFSMHGVERALNGSMLQSRPHQMFGRGVIKQVLTTTVTLNNVTSATSTIGAVDMNNVLLNYRGFTQGGGTDARSWWSRIELTNSTTVTAFVNTATVGNNFVAINIVEFWPGVLKSTQYGTMTGTTSGTATINQVRFSSTPSTTNYLLSLVVYLGHTTDSTNAAFSESVRVGFTNATTISFGANGAGNKTVGFQVVEFL